MPAAAAAAAQCSAATASFSLTASPLNNAGQWHAESRSRTPSKASMGAPARLRAPAPSQREGLQSACLQDDGSEVRERGRTREPAAAGNFSAPARA